MPHIQFPYNGPVDPGRFRGRAELIQAVCDRVHGAGGNLSYVGGPCTGGDSLLRFLTSQRAADLYPPLGTSVNLFMSASDLGAAATPDAFWQRVFHELGHRLPDSQIPPSMETQARQGSLDVFHLEDAFDALAAEDNRVVLCVADLHFLLENANFLPPSDFFHIARSLARRDERGIRFITTSPRPLLDLWDLKGNPSPFYNIFMTFFIGRLTAEDARAIVRSGFEELGIPPDPAVEDFILGVSERHPMLLNYVASLCAQSLMAGQQVSQQQLMDHFKEPQSPLLLLVRRILSHLTPNEKQWIELARQEPTALTDIQRSSLQHLWEYGLLPPGVPLP